MMVVATYTCDQCGAETYQLVRCAGVSLWWYNEKEKSLKQALVYFLIG
jgi:hypothetical protein